MQIRRLFIALWRWGINNLVIFGIAEREGIRLTEEYCNIKSASEILQVSEATIRRKIKRGQIKAELFEGLYGPEYRVSIASLYPSTSVTEVVKVEQALSADDLRLMMGEAFANANALLIGKLDKQEQKIDSLQEELAEMRKLMENKKESWWSRFRRGDKVGYPK